MIATARNHPAQAAYVVCLMVVISAVVDAAPSFFAWVAMAVAFVIWAYCEVRAIRRKRAARW